jgi:hypothetical protein
MEGGPFLRLRGVLAAFAILFEAVVRDGPSLRGQLDREAALFGKTRFDHSCQGSAGAALAAPSRFGQFLAGEPTGRHDLGHYGSGG